MQAAANKKIQVENLRTFYGAKEVHHGISFDIAPNEIFAIIGPAQSGKTTLLRAINRTLEFTPGSRITGLIANQAPIGTYNHQRRVHRGTNSSGVLMSLDQALTGWACRRNMRA